jgi:hypothetical protein
MKQQHDLEVKSFCMFFENSTATNITNYERLPQRDGE